MSNAMGYFTAPTVPAPVMGGAGWPVAATTTPQVPGQQPVATWDTWVATSNADPYVAGMRTSGSAMAAVTGASKISTNVMWNSMLKGRSAAGLARTNATIAKAGSSAASRQVYMAGKSFGSAKAAVKGPGLFKAFTGTFLSLSSIARAVVGSAIIAIPVALVTNFLDWKANKITADQRNALIVADIAGYTATGATATLVGGAIGTTFLGPVVGTVIGVAAGFGLGWVYEKFIRPRWGKMVHGALYATPPAPPVVVPPTWDPK